MYDLYIEDRLDSLKLQSEGINVLDYAMRTARPLSQRQASKSSALPSDFDDISETIRLEVRDVSQVVIQEKVRRLERFFERARQNSRRRPEDAVYLYIKFDSDTWLWRSELLMGEVTVESPLDQLWRGATDVSVTFTRRYFWEMAEANPVELAISASGQGAATGGRNVTFNANQNWIQIASTEIDGSLPAPLILDIENNSGSTQFLTQMWLINNAHASPTTASVTRTAGQMTGPDSNRWLLPDSLVHACKGRYVRALLHHSAGGVPDKVQGFVEVASSGGVFYTIWNGHELESQGITDLGVFPIPPGAESDDYGDIYFRVLTPWDVSYIHLIPVSSERRISAALTALSSGIGVEAGEAVVDDGVLGESYFQYATGVKTPAAVGYGDPLWIWPGMTQRIYIEWAGFSYGDEPGYTATVRAYTRPRRGTI